MSTEDPWMIYTLTGRMIDLRTIRPEDMDPEAIVHGLMAHPRFAGQVVPSVHAPFTVGHHTLAMWEYANAQGASDVLRREVLLHDMPEFLTGDIVSPVKVFLQPAYTDLETRIMDAIRQMFGVPHNDPAMHSIVRSRLKAVDYMSYVAEAYVLQDREVAGEVPNGLMVRYVRQVQAMQPEIVRQHLLQRVAADLGPAADPGSAIPYASSATNSW